MHAAEGCGHRTSQPATDHGTPAAGLPGAGASLPATGKCREQETLMTRISTISFCSLLLAAALTVGIATTAQAGCAPRCSDPVYHAPPVYRAPPTTNSVSTEPVPTNPVAANPAPPPTPIPVRPRPIIVGNPRQGGEGGDPCIA